MAKNKKALLGGKLLFPTDYLSAVEFQGKDVTLEIAGVKREELKTQDGGSETKPILTFTSTKKKLVLNVTNASTIAELHGVEAESWVGKSVTFYPTTTSCFGDRVDCIRVRDKVPAKSKAKVDKADSATPDNLELVATQPNWSDPS